MFVVCVVRQQSVIATYGPFAADEFVRVYLDHESNVQIVRCYGIGETL